MPTVNSSLCALQVLGDDLDPEEVTSHLGKPPTRAIRKGDIWRRVARADPVPARTGIGRIEAEQRELADRDAQVAEILAKTTEDLAV